MIGKKVTGKEKTLKYDVTQKQKVVLISVLLVCCCFLIYFFHFILNKHTIFTHLFYVPVILASLWWGKKSLPIILFLPITLLSSEFYTKAMVYSNDLYRSSMLVIVGLTGILVSERFKRQLQRTQEAEKRIEKITEVVPVGICLISEHNLLWANENFWNISGYEAGSLIGKDIRLLHADDEEYKRICIELYDIDKTVLSPIEARLLSKDGRILECNLRAAPIDFEDLFKCKIVTITDITETKRLNAHLQQSEKMATIGLLAGGVAHDFNNILTVILGNASLALMRLDKNNPAFEKLNEIRKAGDRASALTRQLLTFSRKELIQPKVLNINSLIVETEKMLRRVIGEDIDMVIV